MTDKDITVVYCHVDLPMVGCGGNTSLTEKENRVILGTEQFDAYVPLLEGKRVALFSNHTGIVGDVTYGAAAPSGDENQDLIHFGLDANGNEISYGEHILDALIRHDVNVTAIFSPEHGFRGTEDAGANIDNSVGEKTGIQWRKGLRAQFDGFIECFRERRFSAFEFLGHRCPRQREYENQFVSISSRG